MGHETLARSFEGIGADYDRYRPGFPERAADIVLPQRVRSAVDLGAGTGKFTRLLLDRAETVTAIEPSTAMLDVLRRNLPSVTALDGGAERMPMADGAAQVVTVAQAFHWFDRDAACAEIARVLAPRGTLGLIWNRTDARCAWDTACHRIVHPAVEVDETAASAAEELDGFVFERHEELHWTEPITRAHYIRRWTTVSSYLVSGEARRRALVDAVTTVLDTDPETAGLEEFVLPHVTDVFVYRRA